MGHGIPDFYRGVDIAYQALSQMIVRPKYGGVRWTDVEADVAPNATTWGVSITGRGMIYQIFYYGYSTGVIDTDRWAAFIDGNPFYGPLMSHLRDYEYSDGSLVGTFMNKVDDVNFKYAGGTNMGITFETSYILGYQENEGKGMHLHLRLAYALIST